MLLQYQCVSLNLLHVQEYSKEALYEDHNYIGTKVKLVVRGVYNPATQSDSWGNSPTFDKWNSTGLPYVPANARPNAAAANPLGPLPPVLGGPNFGPPGGTPPTRLGVPAAASDIALRHALMQPRGQLIFSVGGIVNIFSPMQGMPTDVTGGPFPLFCNVVQVYGPRTWIVDYGISTIINECPLYGGNPPALLSHVWQMIHDLDEHYFTKIIIKGRATFRQDALTRMGVEPDNYRGILGMGIPSSCKRESIKVSVGHPRNVIHYEIVDRQLPIGWTQAGVTKVKATHKIAIARSSLSSELGKIDITKPGTIFTDSLKAMAPLNQFSYDVEVWGGQDILRSGLETFARNIIAGREAGIVAKLGILAAQAGGGGVLQAIKNALQALAGSISGSSHFEVEHDIMGKYVRVHKSYITGPLLQLVGGGIGQATLSTVDMGVMSEGDGTSVTIDGVVVPVLITNPATALPGPPGDFNMRGSAISQCVAAALQRSCEIPPAPQLAPNLGMLEGGLPPYLLSYTNPYTY